MISDCMALSFPFAVVAGRALAATATVAMLACLTFAATEAIARFASGLAEALALQHADEPVSGVQ